ncbi:MAG: hypothetical protein B7X04_01520 [Parcubacteria group bacterium 21-54-25]|nr:MAG: hypothetical protein B7X04_01520 [Parcubacteria group bacterium 21-54-25]
MDSHSSDHAAGERADLETTRTVLRYQLAALIAKLLGVALWIFFAVVWPLKITAGKTTIVNVLFHMIANVHASVAISWATTAGFGYLWVRERRIRKKSVRREHVRIVELEQLLDPNRSSSGIDE